MYYIYKLVRGSVASRVFLGYLLIYLFYLIVKAIGLDLLTRILEYFMSVGAIALIVLFQQEIRRFLLLVGKSTSLTNNQFFASLLGTDIIPEEKYPLKIYFLIKLIIRRSSKKHFSFDIKNILVVGFLCQRTSS
jgi:hypothetical protein